MKTKLLAAFVALVVLASQGQAISIGGRASPSISRASVSVSRPAAPTFRAPTPTYKPAATANSLSGGQSVGLTRPAVMNQVRTPVPAVPSSAKPYVPTPSTTPQSVLTPTQVTQAPRTGYGAGALLGAAAAGALADHVLSGNHNGTTVINGGGSGGYAPQSYPGEAAPAYQQQAPVVYAERATPVDDFLWGLLAVCLLGVVGYAAYYVFLRKPMSYDEHLAGERNPFPPVKAFVDIQRAYCTGDEAALRQLLGPNLVDQMIAQCPKGDAAHEPSHGGISFEVVDHQPGRVISIRYKATDYEDAKELNEVWHFVNTPIGWKLDGVEQV